MRQASRLLMHDPGGLSEPLNPKGDNEEGVRAINHERLVSDRRFKWDGMIDDDTREESFLLCVTFSVAVSMYVMAIPRGDSVAATSFTLIMGLVCIINSLRLIHSRFSLAAADVVGITQSIASMREERDQLEKTVSLLNHTAKQLQNEVDQMKCSDRSLKNLASQQNVRFDYLIDLVMEHKMSEEQRKINLRLNTVFLIAETFFRKKIDTNLEKLSMLVFHLQCKLRVHGIEVDTEAFKELVARNGLDGLLKFCSKFLLSCFDEDDDLSVMNMFLFQQTCQTSLMVAESKHLSMLAKKSTSPRSIMSRKILEELNLELSSSDDHIVPLLPREITVDT